MSTSIHHLAAISSDLKQTSAFYCDVLGLRAIRKFSLFGGPKVCHFYWSEEMDNFLTFYHCPGLKKGRRGGDTVHSITFSTSLLSLSYWTFRLKNLGVAFIQETDCISSEPVLCFEDPDGLALRLLFTVNDCRHGFKQGASFPLFFLKGIYGIQICSGKCHEMQRLLRDVFGLASIKTVNETHRFSFNNKPGSIIDVQDCAEEPNGSSGCGMVHHIALQAGEGKPPGALIPMENDTAFRLQSDQYSSIYFRPAEGILFEVITTRPFLYNGNATNVFLGNKRYSKKKDTNHISAMALPAYVGQIVSHSHLHG